MMARVLRKGHYHLCERHKLMELCRSKKCVWATLRWAKYAKNCKRKGRGV